MGKQPGSRALHFDELQRPLPLHLILSTRSGSFIREIPIDDVRFHETLTNGSEISFSVYKEKCVDENGEADIRFWRKIKDLKLAYCRELDRFYELRVNLSESDDTVKSVTAISLGEAEASQCSLYGIEINTEADIARDDYEPSILYNEENKKSSIVHRLISKMPHYTIGEVSNRIRTIQRTFRFDGKSVYDACQEVGKEVGCLFQFECRLGDGHKIIRTVHVRDMLCTCDACGARGDFAEVCEKCGSTSIHRGYGDDTPIYVSRENLAQNIEFEADVDSVKNCFRLVGGDELMTAAIIAQNPNGSQYLWYITDEMREDMSDELRERLAEYDDQYAYYQNEYRVPASMADRIEYYNNLVAKYTPYNSDLRVIADSAGKATTTIVGYPAIMEAYYHTIDMELFLRSGLMPNVQSASTDAANEAAKLTQAKLSPAAVSDLENCTSTTAANAVLNMARCLVRPSFSVKVNTGTYDAGTHVWTGSFTVKNYSDEEDTATSQTITVTINDDLEQYIRQKIDTAMTRDKDEPTDIVDLFALGETAFARELQKYSLKKLEEFRSACQVCMDVMIQHGVNRDGPTKALVDVYNDIYEPYRRKMAAIEAEIKTRDEEIAAVSAERDENGNVIEDGLQSMLERVIGKIHSEVDFESFVGEELMKEFASYRRDDVYENTNYISDGLDNRALFQRAEEFLTAAKYEIARAARVHHSIKATLSNLLQMKEFLPIVDDFKVGNRLRVKVDDRLYVLRLTEFEVDYESFELSVVFSDVMDIGSPVGDIAQILGNARSISTTYNAVMHQAEAGKKSSDVLSNIAENGLKLTTHIVGGAHNQEFLLDESGYLGRTYVPETGDYSPEQIRIISNGIYITDDDWETMKAALGKFQYYDPEDGQTKTGFGVIADQLVGSMLLTKSAGIYNENGSVVINDQGMKIVVDAQSEDPDKKPNNFSIVRNNNGVEETLLGVDNNGDLVIKGKMEALLAKIGGFTIGESALYNGGKISINTDTDGVYLGTNGIALGKGVFEVTKAGALTSKSGTIGGFTIGATELKHSNTSNRAYTVGLNAPDKPAGTGIAIWAGGPVAAGTAPFYVQYDGSIKSTKGTIGGFTITANELYSGNKTGIDVNADGVYLGADGISLGKGKFKVTDAGALTAKSGQIAGFTIADTAIYSGGKSSLDSTADGVYVGTNGISLGDAFKVTDAGKVTASDINITGGSISIKNGNDVVFKVDENGDAYFSGQVDVGQLVGYISADQLNDTVNEALGHAVKYGELEELLGQTYADVNDAINRAVGYAVDYNAINAAIKSAVESYNNATTNGSSNYPSYFRAESINADRQISTDDIYVKHPTKNERIDLKAHTHELSEQFDNNGDPTGKVVIGAADYSGATHFFNIADTKFFKDAVSAASSGEIVVSSLSVNSAYDYSGTSIADTSSYTNNAAFSGNATITLNGKQYENIPVNITGITSDLYLKGAVIDDEKRSHSEINTARGTNGKDGNKLYLKSKCKLQLIAGDNNRADWENDPVIIDYTDNSADNFIDISDYVGDGIGIDDIIRCYRNNNYSYTNSTNGKVYVFVGTEEYGNNNNTQEIEVTDIAESARANKISYTASTPAFPETYGNAIVGTNDGEIHSTNGKKYVSANFNLTAGHTGTTLFDYTNNNRRFNIDVTDLVSDVKIYTPDDNDNPNKQNYNTEQFFSIKANGTTDNYIRIYYSNYSSQYVINYELNSRDGTHGKGLFTLAKGSGESQRKAKSLAYSTTGSSEINWGKVVVTYDDNTTTTLDISPNAYNKGRESYTSVAKEFTKNDTYYPTANERWTSVKVNVLPSYSIEPSSVTEWDATTRKFNFTVNDGSVGYVKFYKANNTIRYEYSYGDNTGHNDEWLKISNDEVLLSDEYFISYSGSVSTDDNKKYSFMCGDTEVGYVRIIKGNGVVKCQYATDNQSETTDDLFSIGGGSSSGGISISDIIRCYRDNNYTYTDSHDNKYIFVGTQEYGNNNNTQIIDVTDVYEQGRQAAGGGYTDDDIEDAFNRGKLEGQKEMYRYYTMDLIWNYNGYITQISAYDYDGNFVKSFNAREGDTFNGI